MQGYRFEARADAKAPVTALINRYNSTRLHWSIGYVPPVEWEICYYLQQQPHNHVWYLFSAFQARSSHL